MKSLAEKLENFFMAAAFAEAGEFETARELLRRQERNQEKNRISSATRVRKELRAPGIRR